MKINREAILWYAIQYDGDWKKIGNAIKAHENYSIIHYPYAYITIMDDAYPDAFKRLRYPPWIIFYQGDINLLKENVQRKLYRIRIELYKEYNPSM